MTAVDQNVFARKRIPDMHCLVKTPGCNALAIRRPLYTLHVLHVAFVGTHELSALGLPHLHISSRFSAAGSSQVESIRRPRYTVHRVAMPFVCEYISSISNVADVYGTVPACEGDALAIRRESDSLHRVRCIAEAA